MKNKIVRMIEYFYIFDDAKVWEPCPGEKPDVVNEARDVVKHHFK
jgi:hypothetical protein